MSPMAFKATLLEKITRSSDTSSYRFSQDPEYTFTAGQWYTISIPAGEGSLDHHFSHADSPTESFIELTTRLTGSEFKNALDALPVGTEVEIRGPYGSFVFAYEAPRIAFLTGGIGITPIRSMLRYLADTDEKGRVAGQELVMFYGSMTEDGIVYEAELAELEKKIAGLRIVHVITNPTESWQGYRGFITADIIQAELDAPETWNYYVVGPPPMIKAMDKVMEQLGIPEKQKTVESFSGYAS
ncbi:MAG: ferredoxin--NADP reductase [Thermoleophilia bacterium]|jgi:ferredoxin-NADP reductase